MGQCNCGAKWRGMSICHCSGCHETFSMESPFKKHRVGSGGDRRCLSVEEMLELGMTYDEDRKVWRGKKPTENHRLSKNGVKDENMNITT
jgi:hypothetical protein